MPQLKMLVCTYNMTIYTVGTKEDVLWALSFDGGLTNKKVNQINSENHQLILHQLKWAPHRDFELYSSSNHISPLLNHPQGLPGVSKESEGP